MELQQQLLTAYACSRAPAAPLRMLCAPVAPRLAWCTSPNCIAVAPEPEAAHQNQKQCNRPVLVSVACLVGCGSPACSPATPTCSVSLPVRRPSTVAEDEGSARPSPARTASRRLYSTHDTSTPAAARAPDCSTMYSTVPSVAARDRVRPVCVVSRLWPRGPGPRARRGCNGPTISTVRMLSELRK